MDERLRKQKAFQTYGAVGMSKLVDENENRRLARLKSVKSSITQHMGRKSLGGKKQAGKTSQMMGRRSTGATKADPKSKPFIQPDFVFSAEPTATSTLTKCGLRLRLKKENSKFDDNSLSTEEKQASRPSRDEKENKTSDKNAKHIPKKLEGQKAASSKRLSRNTVAKACHDKRAHSSKIIENHSGALQETDTE
jgi:hypothetical protein